MTKLVEIRSKIGGFVFYWLKCEAALPEKKITFEFTSLT